eukprot:2730052-Prymnesium_polylepis.1
MSDPPPWQWSVWWANAVKLGSEMGTDFGIGLCRGVGVTDLDLTYKTLLATQEQADFPTAFRAVACMTAGLTSLELPNMDSSPGGDSAELVSEFAEALKASTQLKKLVVRHHQNEWAEAIEKNRSLT